MTVILTEVLTWEVDNACNDGVFLRWENDYGGVDQWYFKGNVAEKPTVGNVAYFEKYIDDLLDTTSNFEIINKTYSERISVSTTFDKANSEGFKQLIRSKQIEMYVLGVWYQIDVKATSFNVEAFAPFGKISLDLIPPKKYIK